MIVWHPNQIRHPQTALRMEKYPSLRSEYPQLPLFASYTLGPRCSGVVGWRVETKLIGVPDSAGWSRPPALPYFGMRIGAAAHTLGSASVLVLAREAVEEAGNLALGVDGFHNGSISSLFDTPWRNVLASHKRCRLPWVVCWDTGPLY